MNGELKNTNRTDHHSYLGNVAIREVFFYDPESFTVIMTSEGKNYRLLNSISEKVKEEFDSQGEPDFSIRDFLIVPVRIVDYGCIVIKMPPVQKKGEVYLIGALMEVPLGKGSVPKNPSLRYFTLEKTVSIFGKDSTLLSSIDNNHQYKEYDEGLPVDEMTFIQKIEKIVSEGL